jgi:hypothetical protein
MDEVRTVEDKEARIQLLVTKVDESKQDPRNFQLTQYLEGELQHLINLTGYRPKVYTVEEYKIR